MYGFRVSKFFIGVEVIFILMRDKVVIDSDLALFLVVNRYLDIPRAFSRLAREISCPHKITISENKLSV